LAHIPIIVNDLVDGISEAEHFSAVHGRGATDIRSSRRPLYLERSRVRFSFLETKGLDELLQEKRDAVIECEGNLGEREPFPHLIPATRDQLESIRSHELVEHRTTIGDPFLGV
jgi:hypothetical protein